MIALDMYNFIVNYDTLNGITPTRKEIMKELNIKNGSYDYNIRKLEMLGLISRKMGSKRNIVLKRR